MKKFISLILMTLLCLSLVGCGDDEILKKEGEVYQKEYRESFTETETSKYGTYEVAYGDTYIIYVRYEEDYSSDYYITKAFYVSKDIYDNTNIGDMYLYNSEKDALAPEPISRTIKEE